VGTTPDLPDGHEAGALAIRTVSARQIAAPRWSRRSMLLCLSRARTIRWSDFCGPRGN